VEMVGLGDRRIVHEFRLPRRWDRPGNHAITMS
jgi:hypothetical protein